MSIFSKANYTTETLSIFSKANHTTETFQIAFPLADGFEPLGCEHETLEEAKNFQAKIKPKTVILKITTKMEESYEIIDNEKDDINDEKYLTAYRKFINSETPVRDLDFTIALSKFMMYQKSFLSFKEAMIEFLQVNGFLET